MEHFFELPVTFNGEILELKGRLVTFAYDYKFYIVVKGNELIFEKDDSGKVRTVNYDTDGSTLDIDLIKAIAAVLESMMD
ncbi:hypothetical protein D3C72_817680 [compost metagenome]